VTAAATTWSGVTKDGRISVTRSRAGDAGCPGNCARSSSGGFGTLAESEKAGSAPEPPRASAHSAAESEPRLPRTNKARPLSPLLRLLLPSDVCGRRAASTGFEMVAFGTDKTGAADAC
jgi:hypothetical protein